MLRSERRVRRISSRRQFVGVACAVLAGVVGLAACGGGGGSTGSSAGQQVTLTVWQNGNLQDTGFGFMTRSSRTSRRLTPDVTIQVVAKPQDNYFALLQTALISHNGPDIADVYAGSYLTSR